MDSNNSVILQDASGRWLRFRNPERIVSVVHRGDVLPALAEVERAVEDGLFAAGFIAYEASPALDRALRTHSECGVPLLWFGLYPEPELLSELPPPVEDYRVGEWRPMVSREHYAAAIDRIRRYIAAGDTYQVNYTIRLRTDFGGSAYALFHALADAQQAPHCAFVATADHAICSASPELFFRLAQDTIVSRPMKGTAPRGLTCDEDEGNAKALQASEKNRAENIMIVDMIRNDIGRIADAGSIHVASAFDIERFPTVLQMTSTVEATTRASFVAIVRALFPCASITGAPKVRTMEIIQELEPSPRGVYTGAVGYLAPGRLAEFNVAIRTVVVNRKTGSAEYGVGGGIVWDSVPGLEYEECLTKAKVLATRAPEFELLETLLWTAPEGYFLKDEHLARMEGAAKYFGFRLSIAAVEDRLRKCADGFNELDQRIRLTVARDGAIRIETREIEKDIVSHPHRVGLARQPVGSRDRFLYHKTTNRRVYDEARSSRPDCDDVILFNERGEVTESTIANVVVETHGRRLTPPVRCGLLAGVFRGHLLARGEISEEVISVERLRHADSVFLVNSVRRWVRVRFVDS